MREIELEFYIVAFIDILGFSRMVREDCQSRRGDTRFVDSLFDVHVQGNALLQGDPSCRVKQFSDSVVLSRPFEFEEVRGFLRRVAAYQRLLLGHCVLCRGGVAMGKHFERDAFLYSDALVEAHRLESEVARYPRVVVSSALVERLEDLSEEVADTVLVASDGITFVDYLSDEAGDPESQRESIEVVLEDADRDPGIQEKLLWLAEYADYSLGTELSQPLFKSR